MGIELDARLNVPFSLRTLRDRVARTRLAGAVEVFRMVPRFQPDQRPEAVSVAFLDRLRGPGFVQPEGTLMLAGGDGSVLFGLSDLGGIIDDADPNGGVWLTVVPKGPMPKSAMLLGVLTAVAAAELGRSVVVDDWSLLPHGREIEPHLLLDDLRRAAPAGVAAGPPGSEAYAAALLGAAGIPRPPRPRDPAPVLSS